MRGGFVPEHYTLALTEREGNVLRGLATMLRASARDGDFPLQEDEDELLEDVLERLEKPD